MITKIYFIISIIFFLFFMHSFIREYLDDFFCISPSKKTFADIFIYIFLSLIWPIFIIGILYKKKMGKIFTLILIYLLVFIPSNAQFNKSFVKNYIIVKQQYKWIDRNLFENIYTKANRQKLDPLLVCSIINAESKGKKYAISHRKARGYMQVMPFHYKKNPLKLYDTNLNLFLGCSYLKFCKNKSYGDLSETLRKYNQGANGNRSKYKNWKYVNTILSHYNYMRFKLNEES